MSEYNSAILPPWELDTSLHSSSLFHSFTLDWLLIHWALLNYFFLAVFESPRLPIPISCMSSSIIFNLANCCIACKTIEEFSSPFVAHELNVMI